MKTTSCIFFVFFPNLFDFLRFDTCIHYFWDPFGPSIKVEYGIHYKRSTLGRFCVHYYWPKIPDFRIQPTLWLSGGLGRLEDWEVWEVRAVVRGERERARGLDAWRFHCCVAERGWFFVCAAAFNCVLVAFLVPAHGSRRVRCSCVIV
jgi:hypothetical protein